jgi:hypothetical protein
VDTPRWLALSGKWWLGPVEMASLSKWKRTATALLFDLLAEVKGGTEAARHGEASQLVGWA